MPDYLIAPFEIGQDRGVEPWLIPNNAFETMNNVELYRGRVKRKLGFTHLDRLRTTFTNLAPYAGMPNANISPYVQNIMTVLVAANYTAGPILPGSVTINIAAPINEVYVEAVPPDGTLTSAGGTGTIDYMTGAINLIHPGAGASVVTVEMTYFKNSPVMGIYNRELATTNIEGLICFNQQSAYVFDGITNVFNDITPAIVGVPTFWTGENYNFFSTANYWYNASGDNILWVVNHVPANGIRYYPGGGFANWVTPPAFVPELNGPVATNFLFTSLLIIPYRNRLVCLNTYEGANAGAAINFPQRARWSHTTDPRVAASWRSDIAGAGGFVDAPTNEKIQTAQFINETLVVGFERSTWALKYTNNKAIPFAWFRVNSEIGCESPWSSVNFNDAMLQIGPRTINAAAPTGCERIDENEPDLVQRIHNQNNGFSRVHGIRNFQWQHIYWTFPESANNGTFPDKVISYNYYEKAFAIHDYHFTCFGNYQPANDMTWAQQIKLDWDSSIFRWRSGDVQSHFPSIVAGNQVGFVSQFRSITSNAETLYITAATQAEPCQITVPNHNLQVGQCLYIEEVSGMTELNENYYFIREVIDANNITLSQLDLIVGSPTYGLRIPVDSTGFSAYTFWGIITLIDQIRLKTKRFNPFLKEGKEVRIQESHFLLSTTTDGEINVAIYFNQNDATPVSIYSLSTTPPVEPPLISTKVWEHVYINSVGNFLQLEFYFNDFQLVDNFINTTDFQLHAMNLKMEPSGYIGAFS